jgi:hypothetical protein
MVRPPLFFCCVICGEDVTNVECRESVWLEEYRTGMMDLSCSRSTLSHNNLSVYSGPEGVSVSGVGLNVPNDRGTFTPPTTPTGRWDDAESRGQPSQEIGIGWESVENSRHGFLLHDACWRVLKGRQTERPAPGTLLRGL